MNINETSLNGTLPNETSPDEIKTVCCNFYEQKGVKFLLGDSFHPGGKKLSTLMGKRLFLSQSDHILDVASGIGTTAMHIAQTFGCKITGIDLSEKNIQFANESAVKKGLGKKVFFIKGDSEKIPFSDGTFSAVICECAFCTFPNKHDSALEISRVLAPGGKLGFSDVTIDRLRLPSDMMNLFSYVACIADARLPLEYKQFFQESGFAELNSFDERWAVQNLLSTIEKRIFLLDIAVGLKMIKNTEINSSEIKKYLMRLKELLKEDIIGYTMLLGRK